VESLVLLVGAGALVVLMVTRSRRQQRELTDVQSRLEVGARIMTTAGLYATVVALDAESVTLETAPGQTSRWDRRAVARVLPAVNDTDPAVNDTDPAAATPPVEPPPTTEPEGRG